MNKIALINPYFGKFPEWMPLFLYSCSRQKNIDFIFYTDCEIPSKIYSNTIFHKISLGDYCDLVSERLHISFHPEKAYKFCDLKPFYGVLHAEELKGYEWWGYGDLDLVYGDLSLLASEHNLSHYDVLTTHADKIAGHFTLVRINSKYTTECMRHPEWLKLLCDQRNYGIDEHYFSQAIMPLQYKVSKTLFYKVVRHFAKKGTHFWYLHKCARLFSFLPTRVFMYEYFTSFAPSKEGVCTYDLKTNKIVCSTNQLARIPKWGGQIYLHFLFYKKTQYWDTDQYWRDGFYKIPDDYDFSKGGIVRITTDGIELINTPINNRQDVTNNNVL